MSWIEKDDRLQKDFQFANFIEAFSFLAKVAIISEKQGHHPEIWNVYNQVILSLSTHDAGDVVTDKDRKLARAIDALES